MGAKMKLEISSEHLDQIHAHGEEAYPGEGAGFMLGNTDGDLRVVRAILKLPNAREESARHNRYLLTPRDVLHSEQEAAKLGLDVIGVFHSHPDHPNEPSEFDRDWAMPWFSYIITSVKSGKAAGSRSWRLTDDRSAFDEELIQVNSEVSI
jgi:proteasome lid subunit RPN8/RPN11